MTIAPSLQFSNEYFLFRNDGTEVKFRIVYNKIHSEKYRLDKDEVEHIIKKLICK